MLQGIISTLCGLRDDAQIGLWELNLRRAEITFFPGPTIGACGKRIIPLRVFKRLLHPFDRRLCSMALAQLLFDGGPRLATSIRVRDCHGDWQNMTLNGRITDYTHDGAALSIIGVCSHDVLHHGETPYRECAYSE